jgi:LacI family transcriptional regulator
MRAAFSLRLRVPEDPALIGFDGINEALHGWVRLTTVSVPLHELAVRAFDTLETWNSDGQEQSVVLPVTVTVGDTCGCT